MQIKIYVNDFSLKNDLRKSLIYLFPKKANTLFRVVNKIVNIISEVVCEELFINYKIVDLNSYLRNIKLKKLL